MSTVCEYFSEEFNSYLNSYCLTLKNARTVVEYQRSIGLLCNYLKKDFLDITSADAALFFNYMQKRVQEGTLCKTTLNSRRSAYGKLAAFICENFPACGYTNAFVMIEPMRGVKNQICPSKIPSLQDIDTFLSHVDSPMYYLIFCMTFRVALSMSDIISLRRCNIQTIDNKYCIHFPPKDDFTPDRIIVLPNDIKELLVKYISELDFSDSAGHLFYNSHKNPVTPRNLDKKFANILKASGITAKYTLQDFRSRAILDMVNASVEHDADLGVVGEVAGIKELRLATYVSARTLVNDSPAELVNIQVRTE